MSLSTLAAPRSIKVWISSSTGSVTMRRRGALRSWRSMWTKAYRELEPVAPLCDALAGILSLRGGLAGRRHGKSPEQMSKVSVGMAARGR